MATTGPARLKQVKSETRLQGVPVAGQGATPDCSVSEQSATTQETRMSEVPSGFSARLWALADRASTGAGHLLAQTSQRFDGVRTTISAVPATLEAKVAPVATAVKARASSVLDTAQAIRSRGFVASAVDAVQDAATATSACGRTLWTKVDSATRAVTSRVELVLVTAKGAVSGATAACAGVYQDVRSKGPKVWLVGVAQDTRHLLGSTASFTWGGVVSTANRGKDAAYVSLTTTKEKVAEVAAISKEKATELKVAACETAKDGRVQATAASALGGAVALGATGGATGLAAGGVIGATVGLVPAVFTFGLSIPAGAMIGSGAGLAIGTALGSAVGALGGGSAGYGVYSRRETLKTGADEIRSKVGDYAEYVRFKAKESAGYVAERASVVRHRLAGGGTGGTESSD